VIIDRFPVDRKAVLFGAATHHNSYPIRGE